MQRKLFSTHLYYSVYLNLCFRSHFIRQRKINGWREVANITRRRERGEEKAREGERGGWATKGGQRKSSTCVEKGGKGRGRHSPLLSPTPPPSNIHIRVRVHVFRPALCFHSSHSRPPPLFFPNPPPFYATSGGEKTREFEQVRAQKRKKRQESRRRRR
jgi:hypothetical protein